MIHYPWQTHANYTAENSDIPVTVSTKPVTVAHDNMWYCRDSTKKDSILKTRDNTVTDIMSFTGFSRSGKFWQKLEMDKCK